MTSGSRSGSDSSRAVVDIHQPRVIPTIYIYIYIAYIIQPMARTSRYIRESRSNFWSNALKQKRNGGKKNLSSVFTSPIYRLPIWLYIASSYSIVYAVDRVARPRQPAARRMRRVDIPPLLHDGCRIRESRIGRQLELY